MPGSRTATDDLTERRRGSKTRVHRLPTPSDTGGRREDDFALSQSLRVPPPATARSTMWENAPASRPQPQQVHAQLRRGVPLRGDPRDPNTSAGAESEGAR